MTRIKAALFALFAVLLVALPATAAHAAHPVQACQPGTQGYWIRDTANPGRVFYVDAGALTSGLMLGWGGTWVIVRAVNFCR
jgi:hypothetical protein